MARTKTRRNREMSDKQLLASAWSALRGSPGVIHPGRPSSTRTAPFSARFRGLCERCGRSIDRGDEIRYHRDFDSPVHSGCRAPEVTVRKVVEEAIVVTGIPTPVVCVQCHLEHAGDCW